MREAQTIDFDPATPITFTTVPITLTATATSGLPVTFTLSSGPATLHGNQLTLTGVGTVVVSATQLGNGSWLPAPEQDVSIEVGSAGAGSGAMAQVITFAALASPLTFPAASVSLVASASSGLPVYFAVAGPGTLMGARLSFTGIGTVTVTATQPGDSTWSAAAPVSQNVVVNPAPLIAPATAAGSPTTISLLEIQTVAGVRYLWSDAPIFAPSALSVFDAGGTATVWWKHWIMKPPSFTLSGTLAVSTGNVTLQNLSGNTVQRDGSLIPTAQILSGAIFIYREWDAAAETALITICGSVEDAEFEDEIFTLSLRGRMDFSSVKAPPDKIGIQCTLTFGSEQCGSTASTPCQNNWGTCSSGVFAGVAAGELGSAGSPYKSRYKGWIPQWSTSMNAPPTTAYAQPVQITEPNLRRAS